MANLELAERSEVLFPCPPLPFLEVGPLNPARGSGERCKLSKRGLGQMPSRTRIWFYFTFQNMTSGGNGFNDFPENQLFISLQAYHGETYCITDPPCSEPD